MFDDCMFSCGMVSTFEWSRQNPMSAHSSFVAAQ